MKGDILGVDVGTTAFKLAVFSPALEKKAEASRSYDVHVYAGGSADIEPEKWWQALGECCAEVRDYLSSVGVIALSVTTPGLTPMAADGPALARACECERPSKNRTARARAVPSAAIGVRPGVVTESAITPTDDR